MKTVFQKFFSSLPVGARLLILFYALGFPLALIGQYTHAFDLYDWLALFPPLVRKLSPPQWQLALSAALILASPIQDLRPQTKLQSKTS